MVEPKIVRAQLKRIGADFSVWGHAEAKELPDILIEGETIQHALNGRYEGGFAMLCATDHRVLLIDKKPLFLALDDIRYEMVTEINYTARLMESMLHVCTLNKTFRFKSLHQGQLRKMAAYIQQYISELRRQQYSNNASAIDQNTAPAGAFAAMPQQALATNPVEQSPPLLTTMPQEEVVGTPTPLEQATMQRTLGKRALGRRAISPYGQVSFLSRRRISPFDFARK